MVQKLTKLGYLQYEKYGIVKLTPKGEKIGRFLLERHKIIEDFLKLIGVKEKLLVNVELIEHNVTKGALAKIKILNSFFKSYPEIFKKFQEYSLAYKEDES